MSVQKSTSPSGNFAAVTPSDVADIPAGQCRGLYVGGDGDVSVVSEAGDSVVFKLAKAGMVLPVITRRVNATGTTASDLVALY
jgi:hypothetical protein